MPIANQPSTRFRDEIRIVSPVAFWLAVLGFLSMIFVLIVIGGRDHNPPALPIRALFGILAGTVLGCYIVLIGYINKDARRRGMSRLLWTLIAIFVPNGLGIVLYFVLRKPRIAHCPQCNAEIEPGFSFCPRCRYRLQAACPHCQRSINPGDKFCPYCGGALDAAAGAMSPATAVQP